jgi:cyclophilin family peptidyl-prolyl cis-trans isomerase
MKTAISTALSAVILSATTLAGGFVLAGYMPQLLVQPAQAAGDKATDPVVLMKTTKGDIKIKIYKSEAPITSNNFLDLVQRHFYDGLVFHRYEPGFVIQGGDPTGTGGGNFVDPKTHQERHIKLEKIPSLKHDAPGMVAMARTSDPDSASCQFYITLDKATFLDNPPGYAVFGKVIDGMDVVQKLRKGDKMLKVTVAQ